MDCIRQNYFVGIQDIYMYIYLYSVRDYGWFFICILWFGKEKFEEFKNLLNLVWKLRFLSILISLNIEMRNF